MGYDEDQPKGQNPSENETLEKKQDKSIKFFVRSE